MASDDDGVWAAAQTIRPYLIDLIGQDAAGPLDRQIAGQLNRAANQPKAVAAMRALLEANEDTSWFLFEVLQDTPRHRPPYLQPRHRLRRGIPSPGGDPGPVMHAGIYECPCGDYVWYRPEVGTPVPECTTHHIPLTRA
jgi:hypothetical protein